MEAARAIVPSLDCDALHVALELRSASVSELPVRHPLRQVLAALRWRAQCLHVPAYSARDGAEGLTYWLALQGGCPLSA